MRFTFFSATLSIMRTLVSCRAKCSVFMYWIELCVPICKMCAAQRIVGVGLCGIMNEDLIITNQSQFTAYMHYTYVYKLRVHNKLHVLNILTSFIRRVYGINTYTYTSSISYARYVRTYVHYVRTDCKYINKSGLYIVLCAL